MVIKKIAIDGMWVNLQFFKEGDGSIRMEVEELVSGKRKNVFPDNKITFKE